MPPPTDSNIRAFVHWKEPTVFAGEEIECIITFKNIAAGLGRDRRLDNKKGSIGVGDSKTKTVINLPSPGLTRRASLVNGPPQVSRNPSASAVRGLVNAGKGHRPALSLNIVSASPKIGVQSPSVSTSTPQTANRPARGHGRSLSIMSLTSENAGDDRPPTNVTPSTRPVRAHTRSASVQHSPRPSAMSSPSYAGQLPRQPSPLYESITPPEQPGTSAPQPATRPQRRRPGTVSAGNTPTLDKHSATKKHSSRESMNGNIPNFQFPARPSPDGASDNNTPPEPPRPTKPSGMNLPNRSRPHPSRASDSWSGTAPTMNPISRVMSTSSMDGTPRNSSDLYSLSNNSNETLTSEAVFPHSTPGKLWGRPFNPRQDSDASSLPPADPETLMMAFAQTIGQFTLDGSLVNAAPFEEVKRKGVQSNGGVVGMERSKRSSGVFGAFSWSNIGESLGGLLGSDDMSTLKQMKATAGSKSVPLLSTPQSLLFIDLTLAPGESRSYTYRFTLPRGLPPSHKGKAIKVNYHLAVGVQRPDGQAVQNVEIPFRVLPSYDTSGEHLAHDLLSPYVLLQDLARTTTITKQITPTSDLRALMSNDMAERKKKTAKQGLEDFLRYTERLTESSEDPTQALLSPTSPLTPIRSRQHSIAETIPETTKDIIDLAILRSNYTNPSASRTSSQPDIQPANRFNIARSSRPVATLTILRPAYRLGESVIGTLDFAIPTPPTVTTPAMTYAVLIELESTETIDPSLALRSSASVARVTRRVHAVVRENTMFARRCAFSLAIPAAATPTFETTGVSLGWRVRVEFTTRRQLTGLGLERMESGSAAGGGGGSGGGGMGGEGELLEELGSDERGTVYIAKELLVADTFEIAVPLKVFGAVGVDGVGWESEALVV